MSARPSLREQDAEDEAAAAAAAAAAEEDLPPRWPPLPCAWFCGCCGGCCCGCGAGGAGCCGAGGGFFATSSAPPDGWAPFSEGLAAPWPPLEPLCLAEGMAGAAAGEAAGYEASERGARPGKLPRAPPGLGERHAGAAGVGAAARESERESERARAGGRARKEAGRGRKEEGACLRRRRCRRGVDPASREGRPAEPSGERLPRTRGPAGGPSPCRHDPKEGGPSPGRPSGVHAGYDRAGGRGAAEGKVAAQPGMREPGWDGGQPKGEGRPSGVCGVQGSGGRQKGRWWPSGVFWGPGEWGGGAEDGVPVGSTEVGASG